MSSTFTILGKDIAPGESAVLYLEVAKLYTRNSINIPVIIERAKKDGPVLLLMAGVHGDEINGVAVLREIIRKKYNKPKKGVVVCIPVFNVFGYLNQARKFPDGRDLNRVFPGTAGGSLASQLAYRFTKEIVQLVDYVIDFHTGGSDRVNFPNIRCVFSQPKELELANVFNAPFKINSRYIPKSIRYTFNKAGKTVLLFEGGKSMEIDQSVVKVAVQGTLNVMYQLGMQTGEIEVNPNTIVVEKSTWLRAPFSGMFDSEVANGTHVKKRTLLGRIYDPYGKFEKHVYATHDCHIFGMNTAPMVFKGDALFHVSK